MKIQFATFLAVASTKFAFAAKQHYPEEKLKQEAIHSKSYEPHFSKEGVLQTTSKMKKSKIRPQVPMQEERVISAFFQTLRLSSTAITRREKCSLSNMKATPGESWRPLSGPTLVLGAKHVGKLEFTVAAISLQPTKVAWATVHVPMPLLMEHSNRGRVLVFRTKPAWGAGGEGTFRAGQDACVGYCACFAGGYYGYFQSGDRSCMGPEACGLAGFRGHFHALHDSCVGTNACRRAAASSGAFQAGHSSCNGSSACLGSGFISGSNFAGGTYSCVGEEACMRSGEGARVTIGDESCTGIRACTPENTVNDFVIGHKSCTCDSCCENLMAGSIIGDCQCTSVQDGCSHATSPASSLDPA